MKLDLSQEEADLLNDILADASLYHSNALDQYFQLADCEVRKGLFDEEKTYHSNAIDLCGDLVSRIHALQKEDSE